MRPAPAQRRSPRGGSAPVGAALLAFTFERLYERDRQQISVSALDEARDFGSTLSFLCFAELLLLQLIGVHPVTSTTLGVFWVCALIGLPAARGVLRHVVVPLLNTPQNTLIIGAGQVGQIMARKIRKHPEYNLRLVGFLDNDPHPLDPALDDLPVIGREDDLVDAIRRYRADRVILAFSKRSPDKVLELIRDAGLREVTLSIIPRYFEIMTGNAGIADVDGVPVIELPAARLSRFARATKRAFDLAFTIPGLILLLPVFAVIAVAITVESRGGVFFRQARRGRGGEIFHIVKFRTMVDGAESLRHGLLEANECSGGPLFKIREDPRVTRVGRLLRRTSLDELPQLWNVFRGHEPRRAAAVRRLRGRPDRRLGATASRPDAGDHRPLAGPRAQRDRLRGDDPPRLPLRDELVALVGHQPPREDRAGCPAARRVLTQRRGGQAPPWPFDQCEPPRD